MLALNQKGFEYDLPFDSTLNMEWTTLQEARDFFDSRITDDDKIALLVESKDLPIGFLVGSILAPDSYRIPLKMAELDIMFIEESYRHQGVGAQLMAQLVEWAKEQGCVRLTVTASSGNEVATSFYRRQGFSDYDLVLEKEI